MHEGREAFYFYCPWPPITSEEVEDNNADLLLKLRARVETDEKQSRINIIALGNYWTRQ